MVTMGSTRTCSLIALMKIIFGLQTIESRRLSRCPRTAVSFAMALPGTFPACKSARLSAGSTNATLKTANIRQKYESNTSRDLLNTVAHNFFLFWRPSKAWECPCERLALHDVAKGHSQFAIFHANLPLCCLRGASFQVKRNTS